MKRLLKQILLIILFVSVLSAVTAFAEPADSAENESAAQDEAILGWIKTDKGFINDQGEIIEGAQKRGVDVSVWQNDIDWKAVKKDDVDFAILRCGYGQDLKEQDDSKWFANANACTKLGIPFGAYLFSYATSWEGAIGEAEHAIRLLSGYNLSYPVYYDLEAEDTSECSNEMLGVIVDAFCSTLSDAGYQVGVYSSLKWWNLKLTSPVFDNPAIYKWIAQWVPKCSYEKPFKMWQASSKGSVKGINGDVDLDFLFDDGITHASHYNSNIMVFTIDKKEAYVFGKRKAYDVAPITRNDRTMLPARYVSENLGAKVEWDEEAKEVIITKDDTIIVIPIDSDIAYANDKQITLDSPAFIENDRTYTPLRFIVENLGATVEWDEKTKGVIITKK